MKEQFNCLEQCDVPTEIEQLVGVVSKTMKVSEVGLSAWPVTLRVPFSTHTLMKAVAQYSGRSVNQIAVGLMRVGLDELRKAMPADEMQAIYEVQSEVIAEYRPSDVFPVAGEGE